LNRDMIEATFIESWHDWSNIYWIVTWLKQHLFTLTLSPLNAKLNPICHFLALLGAHPIFHVSRIRVTDKTKDTSQPERNAGICDISQHCSLMMKSAAATEKIIRW